MTSDEDDAGLDFSEIDIFNVTSGSRRSTQLANAKEGAPHAAWPSATTELASRSSFEERFQDVRKMARSLHERTLALIRKTERRKLKKQQGRNQKLASQKAKDTERAESQSSEKMDSWDDVKGYLNINSHLSGEVPHGRYGPKTELESMVDAAIADGDFDKAEVLSDNLANSEFAVKITGAFAAKRYAEELQKKKVKEYMKKQKKLPWGFEAKQRWEMKGNM